MNSENIKKKIKKNCNSIDEMIRSKVNEREKYYLIFVLGKCAKLSNCFCTVRSSGQNVLVFVQNNMDLIY